MNFLFFYFFFLCVILYRDLLSGCFLPQKWLHFEGAVHMQIARGKTDVQCYQLQLQRTGGFNA